MATAVVTAPAKEPAPRRRTVAGRLAAVLVTLPDRLITWFLAVSVVVAIALLVGQFRPVLVLPVAVLAVVLTSRLVPHAPQVDRPAVAGAGLALVLAIAWYAVQRGHTAEMFGLDRDPAQYTLSALYLLHHTNPDVALDPALPGLAAQVPGVLTDFLKGDTGAVNHVQGNALLPGLLAVFGWLHGVTGVLTGNVAIGALALLSVYAVARRILGPLWGLGPMLLLAVTMPLAAFSRSPYTEPTALIFLCGLLVALWVAVERSNLKLFALAGAFAGATMIARIDGGLTVVAGLGAVALLAVAPVSATGRRHGRLALLIFAWGAAPAAALGFLDLSVHSPQYLSNTWPELRPLLIAMPLVLVVGLVASLLHRVSAPVARWLATHRRLAGTLAGVLVAVGCLALVSRPLWLVSHFIENRNGLDYLGAVAARQKAEGLPIDGTQSYDEMTVSWLAWYLSWPVVAAAMLGAVLAAVQFCRRRDARLLVVWVVPVLVGLVYLNKIAITPDQIWAMRRLVPVVLPATAIGTVFAFRAVITRLPRLGVVRAAGVLVMVTVLVAPAATWGKLFDSREGVGEYDLIERICANSGDGLIVQAGPYPIMGSALPALQETCSDKVVSIQEPTVTSMAEIKAAWTGPGPITVVAFFPDAVTWTTPIDPAKPLARIIFNRWESVISHRPEKLNLQQVSVWMGTLDPSGKVIPLTKTPLQALSAGS